MAPLVNLVPRPTGEKGRLIVLFDAHNNIEIQGEAGSADMALASVVLAKLATDSLEAKQ